MSDKNKVQCSDCTHFRSAPYEARLPGCFKDSNMPGKQKDAFLDEQQIPGDHELINLRGDCPDFNAKPKKLSFIERMLAS